MHKVQNYTVDIANIEKYELGKVIKKQLSVKQIVLIGGCFDILHYGHIEFLRKAKLYGDYLIVALENDARIVNYKKRVPIHNQEQRALNLSSIRYIDKVLLLPYLDGFKDYNQLVQDIMPNIIAVTKDDPQILNKKLQAKKIGAEVEIIIDNIDLFSSNKIIQILSKYKNK